MSSLESYEPQSQRSLTRGRKISDKNGTNDPPGKDEDVRPSFLRGPKGDIRNAVSDNSTDKKDDSSSSSTTATKSKSITQESRRKSQFDFEGIPPPHPNW